MVRERRLWNPRNEKQVDDISFPPELRHRVEFVTPSVFFHVVISTKNQGKVFSLLPNNGRIF